MHLNFLIPWFRSFYRFRGYYTYRKHRLTCSQQLQSYPKWALYPCNSVDCKCKQDSRHSREHLTIVACHVYKEWFVLFSGHWLYRIPLASIFSQCTEVIFTVPFLHIGKIYSFIYWIYMYLYFLSLFLNSFLSFHIRYVAIFYNIGSGTCRECSVSPCGFNLFI